MEARHCGPAQRSVITRCFPNRVATIPWTRRAPPPTPALAGSAGGDGGISGGGLKGTGGGGSGRGDGPGASNSGGQPSQPSKGGLAQGWADRIAYDPEFPVKVLLEQVIGVSASVVGDMSSRPNWGLNELDFVFSTLVVGSVLNFLIMYLLAPTASTAASGAAAGGFIARVLSDATLKSWGAPGGNMFEAGAYSVGGRLLNVTYKGTVFAVIGFLAGIAGTAISNTLLALRKSIDPNFKLVNEQPGVLANAGCWGIHMGVSANLRYQLLGGLDPIAGAFLPLPLLRVYQAGIRAANNVVGGISFVTLARVLGVQKSAAASPALATA
ncbi:hypothetical protein QJQ45_020916 [Haematococcus lacustris]|nr:hypothetical protein QJQ45_020916 [Haematococcus lacustris]